MRLSQSDFKFKPAAAIVLFFFWTTAQITFGTAKPKLPDLPPPTWPPNSGKHFLTYPPTDRAEEAVEQAELLILAEKYSQAESAYKEIAKRFKTTELGIHVEETFEISDPTVKTYEDLSKYRLSFLDCLRNNKSRFFKNSAELAKKVIEAIKKTDSKIMAPLVCEIFIVPTGADGARYSPTGLGRYFEQARKANPAGSTTLLPFKVLRKTKNKSHFLIAMSGFQYGEPSIPNDIRIAELEHSANGWLWTSVTETNAKELNNDFSFLLAQSRD